MCSCSGMAALLRGDEPLGFGLDHHPRVDQRADLEYRGRRAYVAEQLAVGAANLLVRALSDQQLRERGVPRLEGHLGPVREREERVRGHRGPAHVLEAA